MKILDKKKWEEECKAMSKALGEHIIKLREQKGMSINELSKTTRIRFGKLVQIEKGEIEALITHIFRIAIALHVTPAYLLYPGYKG